MFVSKNIYASTIHFTQEMLVHHSYESKPSNGMTLLFMIPIPISAGALMTVPARPNVSHAESCVKKLGVDVGGS